MMQSLSLAETPAQTKSWFIKENNRVGRASNLMMSFTDNLVCSTLIKISQTDGKYTIFLSSMFICLLHQGLLAAMPKMFVYIVY